MNELLKKIKIYVDLFIIESVEHRQVPLSCTLHILHILFTRQRNNER